MKKKIMAILMIATMIGSLLACGSTEVDSISEQTQTQETDVIEEKVCNHEWIDATCEAPRTCKVCGVTEGKPLEHDWKPATLDEPKTCKNCGATEGDPIKFEEAEFEFAPTKEYGVYGGIRPDYVYEVDNYNSRLEIDGQGIIGLRARKHYIFSSEMSDWERVVGIDAYDWKNDSVGNFNSVSSKSHIFFGINNHITSQTSFSVYDNDWNQIDKDHIISGSVIDTKGYGVDERYKLFLDETGDVLDVFDSEEQKWLGKVDISSLQAADPEPEPSFDTSSYDFVEYISMTDGYLALEANQFEFLDKYGNEIGNYSDATLFGDSGFAFVSNDKKTYDLIDKDFNVVAEDLVTGTKMYYVGWDLFNIIKEDGSNSFCRIITSE